MVSERSVKRRGAWPCGGLLHSIRSHLNGHDLAAPASMIRNGLRIILMSGNPDKELESHGIKRGTFPFLAKPFERQDLIAIVQHVLAQPAPTMAVDKPPHINGTEWYG
jgi:FixJ family two-component response regulator